MVIFSKVAGGIAAFWMLYFLLRSRFKIDRAISRREALCGLVCAGLLCLDLHWAAYAALSFLAALGLAWFMGQAKGRESLLFGLLFAALQLVAAVIALAIRRIFPNTATVAFVLLQRTVLYLVVIFAVLLRSQWHTAATAMLHTVPPLLVMALLCEELIRNYRWSSIAILEFLASLWLVYASLVLLQIAQGLDAELQAAFAQEQNIRQHTLQKAYYEQLVAKNKETRALWHDLNKYLLAAKAETDASRALSQLEALLDSAMEIVDIGNPVLNVILNEYNQVTKALDIQLRLKVQVPAELGVSTADLYILIGNTMDNAIEACKTLPTNQRLIDLTLRTHHDILFYKLANPYDSLRTKTARDPIRGYGLENVQQCVNRYNGGIQIKREQGFFVFSAHLNQTNSIQ